MSLELPDHKVQWLGVVMAHTAQQTSQPRPRAEALGLGPCHLWETLEGRKPRPKGVREARHHSTCLKPCPPLWSTWHDGDPFVLGVCVSDTYYYPSWCEGMRTQSVLFVAASPAQEESWHTVNFYGLTKAAWGGNSGKELDGPSPQQNDSLIHGDYFNIFFIVLSFFFIVFVFVYCRGEES